MECRHGVLPLPDGRRVCPICHDEAVELSKRETAEGRIASATRLGFVSYARAMREAGR